MQISEANLLLLAAKTIGQALNEYENILTRLAFDVLNGNMGAVDFRRAHKALIKSSARNAFEEAWLEAGGDLDDTEADDISLIGEFVSEQSGFVKRLRRLACGDKRRGQAELGNEAAHIGRAHSGLGDGPAKLRGASSRAREGRPIPDVQWGRWRGVV